MFRVMGILRNVLKYEEGLYLGGVSFSKAKVNSTQWLTWAREVHRDWVPKLIFGEIFIWMKMHLIVLKTIELFGNFSNLALDCFLKLSNN